MKLIWIIKKLYYSKYKDLAILFNNSMTSYSFCGEKCNDTSNKTVLRIVERIFVSNQKTIDMMSSCYDFKKYVINHEPHRRMIVLLIDDSKYEFDYHYMSSEFSDIYTAVRTLKSLGVKKSMYLANKYNYYHQELDFVKNKNTTNGYKPMDFSYVDEMLGEI
jgi:hypothetical protein